MTIRGMNNRAKALAGKLRPACGPYTRILRTRREGDPEYVPTEEDRCPNCGELECGLLVVTEVVVNTREEIEAALARNGGPAVSQERP